MEIEGKKAVIVGGASGFGRATAESLAKRGASVAVLDRPQSKGAEVADATGGTFHEVDVTDFAGTEQVLQQAVDGLGGLHIAVTTAGGGIGERTIKKDGPHGLDNAPIVHALRGKEFIEYDNPFDVGMTGLLGFASGYKAIKEADALLLLGTDFPYQQFYPDNAKIGNLGSWAKDRVAARHQQRQDQWRCLRPGEQTGSPGDRRSRAVLGKTIP